MLVKHLLGQVAANSFHQDVRETNYDTCFKAATFICLETCSLAGVLHLIDRQLGFASARRSSTPSSYFP